MLKITTHLNNHARGNGSGCCASQSARRMLLSVELNGLVSSYGLRLIFTAKSLLALYDQQLNV